MEQRDYLEKQIEQLGKVLGELITRLTGRASGSVIETIDVCNEHALNEFDLDINEILTLNGTELELYLVNTPGMIENLDALTDYLIESGKMLRAENDLQANDYLKKSLELMDLADRLTGIASLKRENRRGEVEELLRS